MQKKLTPGILQVVPYLDTNKKKSIQFKRQFKKSLTPNDSTEKI